MSVATKAKARVDGWVSDDPLINNHNTAMQVLDLEGHIALGLILASNVLRVDEVCRIHALESGDPEWFDAFKILEIALDIWNEHGWVVLDRVSHFEELGYEVVGANELRSQIKEIQDAQCEPGKFFGSPLADLRDSAIDEARSGDVEPLVPGH